LKHNDPHPYLSISRSYIITLCHEMNRIILNQIKRAIRLKLDDKAGQIIESNGKYLSKHDLTRLIAFMNKNKSYSYDVIRYIYYVSPYRHDFDSFEHNHILIQLTEHDYPKTTELLLRDSRFDRRNDPPITPYSYVNERTVRLLLENNTHYGYELDAIFETACIRGFYDIVSDLLKSDAVDPSCDNNSPIRSACIFNRLPIVQLLLRDGRANPADTKNETIYYACYYGSAGMVKLLLEDERVDPDDARNPHKPIHIASHLDITRLLMNDGRVDPSSKNNKALRNAMSSDMWENGNKMQIIELLLTDRRVVRNELGMQKALRYAESCSNTDEIIGLLTAALQNVEK